MTNIQTSVSTTMNRHKPAVTTSPHKKTKSLMRPRMAECLLSGRALSRRFWLLTVFCLPVANGSSAIKWNCLRTLRGTS